MSERLVIGVGNADRGDDAAGLIAARHVGEAAPQGVRVVETKAEPHTLMDAWRGAPAVWLIDACALATKVGTVHRFDAHTAPLPESLGALSSHGVGLGTTIELARALGLMPPRLIVFAIEAKDFAPGGPVSAEIAEAARRVAGWIGEEVARCVAV